jgi:hypothetical protein
MPAVQLSNKELELLREALDSHMYWQLSDEKYRNDADITPPGSDDPDSFELIQQSETLWGKIHALIQGEGAKDFHRRLTRTKGIVQKGQRGTG